MAKFDFQSGRNEGILHKTLCAKSFYSHWNMMAKGKKGFHLHRYFFLHTIRPSIDSQFFY